MELHFVGISLVLVQDVYGKMLSIEYQALPIFIRFWLIYCRLRNRKTNSK